MKVPSTLPNVCLPFQLVVETLRNTTLTLFCMVTNFYKHPLFLLFPGEAGFRLFLNLKEKLKVSTGLLSPFLSPVFQFSESAE